MKTIWAVGLLAAVAAMPAPASAGTRVGLVITASHHDGGRHGDAAYARGYERGLRDGRREGVSDARHRDWDPVWQDRRYRAGDPGYRRSYGPRPVYVAGYRDGFERGYRSAFPSVRGRYDRRDGRWDDRDRRGRDEYLYEDRRWR